MGTKRKILIVLNDKRLQALAQLSLEGILPFGIVGADSMEEAESLVVEAKGDFVVVISDNIYGVERNEELRNSVLELCSDSRFFLLADGHDQKSAEEANPTADDVMAYGDVISLLGFRIKRYFADKRVKDKNNYKGITLPLLQLFDKVPCNIYVQLSADRFVKVFNAGESVGPEDIKRYEGKDVNKLYIGKDVVQWILTSASLEIERIIKGDALQIDHRAVEASDLGIATAKEKVKFAGKVDSGSAPKKRETKRAKKSVEASTQSPDKGQQLDEDQFMVGSGYGEADGQMLAGQGYGGVESELMVGSIGPDDGGKKEKDDEPSDLMRQVIDNRLLTEEEAKALQKTSIFFNIEHMEEAMMLVIPESLRPKRIARLIVNLAVTEQVTKRFEKLRKESRLNRPLGKLLQNLELERSEDSYFYERITLSRTIACSLAQVLDWASDVSLQKIIYMTQYHDILLIDNPELIVIRTEEEMDRRISEFSPDQYRLFLGHPQFISEIIVHDLVAPAGMSDILLQHHELPNRKGFPTKLASQMIAPYAVLLSISVDFAQYILNNPDWTYKKYYAEACRHYLSGGSFAPVMNALKQLAPTFK
jgi:hypothetical protein